MITTDQFQGRAILAASCDSRIKIPVLRLRRLLSVNRCKKTERQDVPTHAVSHCHAGAALASDDEKGARDYEIMSDGVILNARHGWVKLPEKTNSGLPRIEPDREWITYDYVRVRETSSSHCANSVPVRLSANHRLATRYV